MGGDQGGAGMSGAVTVKPLMWEDLGNGRAYRAACPLFGSIRIEAYYSGEFHVLWSVPGFCDSFTPGLYETAELAKAAAQADYEARILSALTIHPADPLSDPRVVALVDEASAFDSADWYWRTMDPDDSGESPDDAIYRGNLGQFCVCEIASSYRGPTRYGFIAPSLDPENDDEEFVHFATHEEAMVAAKSRAALRAIGGEA